MIKLNAQIQWIFRQTKTGARYVAVCDPLGLTVEGDTYPELNENIIEAQELVLTSLMKTGDLDSFLKERGWSSTTTKLPVPDGGVKFDVPFELIAMKNNSDSSRLLSKQATRA